MMSRWRWTPPSRSDGAAGLLLALLAGCAAAPQGADLVAFSCPEPCDLHATGWAGDTLIGDSAQPLLNDEGYDAVFSNLGHLDLGDAFVINAEAPITALTEPFHDPPGWHYNAFPEAAAALARFGVDAVGLSNNHVYDRGPDGLADTFEHTDAVGIAAFGAGMDIGQAREPLLIETGHGRLAVLAFHRGVPTVPDAGPDQPGALRYTSANLRAGRERALERGAAFVAAYVHWGANYSQVDGEQREAAERFAAEGYDLVVGHGSHMQQEIELIGHMPVLFSVGNFIFGTGGRFTEEFPGYGLLVRTFLGEDGFVGLGVRCLSTDNGEVRFRPRECAEAEAVEVLGGLHDQIEVVDGEGWIGW